MQLITAMQLRPYQETSIKELAGSIRAGNQTNILQIPTGGGKTFTAASIIKRALDKGKKVLFIAPRRELVEQASAALHTVGAFNTLIMSGEELISNDCYVASSDTLYSWVYQRQLFPMPQFDLVIWDEAHLSMSKTRLRMLNDFKCPVIGLTATPARGDRTPLGTYWNKLITVTTVKELIADGYLVQPRYFGANKDIDLSGVPLRSTDKDYMPKPLAERMNKTALIGDIVDNWRRLANGKQTVVFCTDIKHSIAVAEQFLANGIAAEHIDAYATPDERRAIFERVRSGETQVLTNVFLASYGLDIPSLEVCILARPTKNLTLYFQMVGRVLRPSKGKTEAIIIDHASTVHELGFVEDDFEWDIHTKERAADLKKESKKTNNEPKEVVCPECKRIYVAARVCPHCGHRHIAEGAPIPVHKADLKEIKPKYTHAEKELFLSELMHYARAKRRSSEWAYDVYRYRYKTSAHADRVVVKPVKGISPEGHRYITHINIKRSRKRFYNRKATSRR